MIGGLGTGQIPEEEVDWFEEHGPDFLLEKIRVPTMIAQGTVDTLFDLNQGHRNYLALERNDIPLKMMWFCGGHGVCNVDADGSGALADSELVQKRRLQWFDRYLKGNRKTRTGPPFEWIDQNGEWHRQPWRLSAQARGPSEGNQRRRADPAGAGNQPDVRLSRSWRAPTRRRRSPCRSTSEGGEEVVGAPTLRFTYSATGLSATRTDGLTHIYGQIVDLERNVVVGNQSTPIPIKLDGEDHTIRASPDTHRERRAGRGLRASARRASPTCSTPSGPPGSSRSQTSRPGSRSRKPRKR